MSKSRGFCLEDIYSRQSIHRLEASKYINEGDDRYIRATLADNPLYKKVMLEFGEQGIRDFVRTIEMKKFENIESQYIIWIYVLNGNLIYDQQTIGKDEWIDLLNPQQNQKLSMKKSQGTALIYTKRAYQLLKQRHEIRQQNKIMQIFNKLPFFTDLPHIQLKALCRMIPQYKFEKGAVVYNQDQLANKLFIVKEGTFMNRYNEDRKKHKSVLLLDNYNIFGQECLQFSVHSQYRSHYLCEVSCKSNQGVLFVLQRSMFAKFPLEKDLSLPTNIYQMYKQRRRIAENKQFQEQVQTVRQKQGSDTIKKYYQRLHRLRKRNPNRFVQKNEDLYTDIQFFKKQQFISMKLKLKYQSILEKVKTMNTVTLQKIQINTKNQPKNFTKGIVDIQKKFFLKALDKKSNNSRSFRNQSQMVMNALKNHASHQDYPRHKSEYLRTKTNRLDLYNSQHTQNVVNKNGYSPLNKIKSQSNAYNFLNQARLSKT